MRVKIIHLTTVHKRNDTRVRERVARSVVNKYPGQCQLIVADGKGIDRESTVPIGDLGRNPKSRVLRILVSWYRGMRVISREKPTVVHFHDPELLPVAILWNACGIKVIYDVHEEIPKQIAEKRWIPPSLRQPLSGIVKRFEFFLVLFVDGVVAATPVIAKNYPVKKTWIVQNFPSSEESLDCSRTSHDSSESRFFYIGGITRRRGIFEILDALLIARKRADAKLLLAGWFSSSDERTEAEQHEAWAYVEYIGWADRETVASCMSQSIAGLVLCHPERNYLEAQPTKLYEYMWGGLPVIASDFPYWRKATGDQEGVIFTNPESAEAIGEAMIRIIKNREWGRRVGRELQVKAKESFAWEVEEKKLLDMYERIIRDS